MKAKVRKRESRATRPLKGKEFDAVNRRGYPGYAASINRVRAANRRRKAKSAPSGGDGK